MATLDGHLEHSRNFKNYRGHKAQYKRLYAQCQAIKKAGGFGAERKAQKALDAANEYYEAYRPQIAMYDNAEKYLCDVLQGHFDPKKPPPVSKWKAEREKLAADKQRLNGEYTKLKNDTATVEKIRSNIYDILREETRTVERTKSWGMEF